MNKQLETIANLMKELKAKFSNEPTPEPATFETATLPDGTVIEWEGELMVGTPIFVVDGENRVPVFAGTHNIEDGRTIITDEDGIVTEIVEAEMNADDKTIFSKTFKENFAELKQINKWSTQVDQDTFEIGTALTYSYELEGGKRSESFSVGVGEFETKDGKVFITDSSGTIRVFLGSQNNPNNFSSQKVNEIVNAKMSEVLDTFSKGFESITSAFESMSAEHKALKEEFEAFKKLPSNPEKENQKFNRQGEDSNLTAKQNLLLKNLKRK
jgi:hypothetical protein